MTIMAVLKNCYGCQKLMKMMATIIMMFMLAPIIALIIGSLIVYTIDSWQDIFHFLTIYGIILLILTLIMPETHPSYKHSKNLEVSFKAYSNHFMNILF